jgi:hypothetical protein
MCKNCYNRNHKTSIKQSTLKTIEKKKIQSSVRDVYFEWHIDRCKFSEESGKPINTPSRVNICHLWPKRIYKSVQSDVENCIYLTWEEHTRFDYLLDIYDFDTLAQEFKCWEKVVERMEKLLPKIEEMGKLRHKFEAFLDRVN